MGGLVYELCAKPDINRTRGCVRSKSRRFQSCPDRLQLYYILIAYTCGGQKSWEKANMLITYSSGGQTSMECAYMRITYTCGELKSSGRAYMLIVYTWVGKGLVDVTTCWLPTPALGKNPLDVPTCWSHTPTEGKSLENVSLHYLHTQMLSGCHRVLPQAVPRRPSATSEYLLPLLEPIIESKSLENGWKVQNFTFLVK